ncbi:hypothetical protein ACERIT_07695 [Halopenitus sp. H-Gu1]|uniref:DUF7333 family protein n=1 Tax=Halopenitus sp. H-Gu1 TaxID=3242697 RepID=UPI00359EE796
MQFDFLRSVGTLVVVTVLGIVGLAASGAMPTRVIFMMVLPSMILFAVVAFVLGMKHGEYRAGQ